MEQPDKGEIVIYQTDDGASQLDVRLENETVWLTQDQMSVLFERDRTVIGRHISNIFAEGELDPQVVCANFAHTTTHGAMENKNQTRLITCYNLDVVISVGYRVKSIRGVQFRQWATKRIHEYIVKGFTLDDERLKSAGGGKYWRELLQRIQDIRMDERMIYRQVLDLFSTAYDYDGKSETAREFFAAYQNKFHFAIHKHTASELIMERADADKEFMGLTVVDGGVNSVTVTIAKNYMTAEELDAMRSLVSGFFDFAELQAKTHTLMYMSDYMELLENLINVNHRPLLQGKGTKSMKQAKEYALSELKKYRAKTLSPAEEDYMETIRTLNQQAKKALNHPPHKK